MLCLCPKVTNTWRQAHHPPTYLNHSHASGFRFYLAPKLTFYLPIRRLITRVRVVHSLHKSTRDINICDNKMATNLLHLISKVDKQLVFLVAGPQRCGISLLTLPSCVMNPYPSRGTVDLVSFQNFLAVSTRHLADGADEYHSF